MADVYEKDFEEKAQPAFTDFLRLIGGDDDAAYKVLVSDIAKAIIEQYTGSTIAGDDQSLQTALNAIDTGIGDTAMGTTATTVTGAIAEHTDKIGNDTMGTTATSLTGAIAEHSDLIGDTAMGTTASTLTGAIAEHSDLIGDDTMGTTATTLTGAIAEHEQELGDLNSNSIIAIPFSVTLQNVSADGSGNVEVAYTKPSGYTAIGTCCWLASASNRFIVWGYLTSQSIVSVMYLNARTSAVSSQGVNGLVFCKKN